MYWLEPSLDRLWKSLDKFFPLFRLLRAFEKNDLIYVSAWSFRLAEWCVIFLPVQVLRGQVTQSDWERFDYYARRVKSFCYIHDPDSLDIAMHVYFRIAQLRSAPLLPSLRHLKCPHMSPDDFLISSICLFLTPSLKFLHFEKITAVEDKLIGTFLHTLLCEGARIQQVTLTGEGLTKDTLGYLGRCVCLRSLILRGMGKHVGIELIRSLGRLSVLERLELDLEESGLMTVHDSGRNETQTTASHGDSAAKVAMNSGAGEGEFGFRELTWLELVAPLSFVKTFLVQIGTTQLRHIGFEFSLEDPVDRRELLACVALRWRDTVTYIRMMHTPDPHNPIPEVSMDALSPLFNLTELKHLEIESHAIEMTNRDIQDIADAPWASKIHTLRLPFVSTENARPSISALQVLSGQCPELRYLTIPISTWDMLQEERTTLHRLRVLTVASSDERLSLVPALRLARIIDRLFPFLERVCVQGEETEGGRWAQVHAMVRMYQSVRADIDPDLE